MLGFLNSVGRAAGALQEEQDLITYTDESPSAGATALAGDEPWNSKSEGFMWVRATPTDLTIGSDQYIVDMNDGDSSPSIGIRIEPDDQMRNRYRDDSGDISSDDLEENRSVEDTLRTYGVTWSNPEGKVRLVSGGAYIENTFTPDAGSFADDTWSTLNIGSRNGGSQPFTGTYDTLEIGADFLTTRQLGLRMKHSNMITIVGGGQSLMGGYWSSADGSNDGGYIEIIENLDSLYSGAEVLAINGATGSSALSNLSNGSNYWWHRTNQEGGPAYDSLVDAVRNIGATPDWMFWAQGEEDSGHIDDASEITAAQYKADLLALFNQIRNAINPSLKIGIQAIGRRNGGYTNTGGIQTIREIQQEIISENDWIYPLGETYDQELFDQVHLTNADYAVTAGRITNAAAKIDGKTVSGSTIGPQLVSATRAGTNVDVVIAHDQGTDFTPTTGIVGFRYFDDGAEITVNSAARIDATTIRLVLNATPSGVEELYYGYDDMSDITNANIANVLRDNTASALPLVPGKITVE